MNGPHSRHNALKFLGALPGILHIEPGAGVGRLDAIRSAVQGESEGGLYFEHLFGPAVRQVGTQP